MIDIIFLPVSFSLFLASLILLMYDVLSPKMDRSKSLGKDLPKYTKYSLLLIMLSIITLVIASFPYMTSTPAF